MASIPSYARTGSALVKRVRLSTASFPTPVNRRSALHRPQITSGLRNLSSTHTLFATTRDSQPLSEAHSPQTSLTKEERLAQGLDEPRLPRSVQAAYLRPLRRQAKHGVPACDLQLRSYSVRNLELMADFALRAAYYLGLPASGPVPLPRLVQRWTVSRSTFAHKKSQENFERITMRRLVQIQDAHPDVVQTWLAFIRKHAYYGVGMKANVWEHEKLGVGKEMDVKLQNMKQVMDPKWAHFGRRKTPQTAEQVMELMKTHELRRIDDGPMRARD